MNARKNVIRRLPTRCGYALVVVLLFNVLFLMLLGVAYRQMASAIRIATVRTEQIQRDEGVVCALARAMYLLETGRPPTITDTNEFLLRKGWFFARRRRGQAPDNARSAL